MCPWAGIQKCPSLVSPALGHVVGPCLGAHIFEKPYTASRWRRLFKLGLFLRDGQLVQCSPREALDAAASCHETWQDPLIATLHILQPLTHMSRMGCSRWGLLQSNHGGTSGSGSGSSSSSSSSSNSSSNNNGAVHDN